MNPSPHISHSERGFTLVEMIVAIALFAIVMVVAVGALLSLTGANRKAQALQSVMNNLNIALDGMVRNVRMGTEYDCVGGISTGPNTADCGNGLNGSGANTVQEFMFTCNPDSTACGVGGASRWAYVYDPTGTLCRKNAISISKQGGSSGTWSELTAQEVSIDDMKIYVVGTKPGNSDQTESTPQQPKVLIVIKGTAGALNGKTKTSFHIQATAVQRQLDLQ